MAYEERRSYWFIEVIHDHGYSGWMILDKDTVGVSCKGYPSTRGYALFNSEDSAEKFLGLNRTKIETRCAQREGFDRFEINGYSCSAVKEVTAVESI